jgi:serine/threonine protein kinase
VGKYQVLGELARGGVGVVLKSHDTELGRDVALKVLLKKYGDDPQLRERFIEEAQVGGQLQHPGIVPVYDIGFADGRPFFAMKLVKGRTLSALLAERKDASSELVRFLGIFEQICQTVAYAHAHGVIHRDLKPSNVMVGAFGECRSWTGGLPRCSSRAALRTRNARRAPLEGNRGEHRALGARGNGVSPAPVLGTPAYMPPEQARGEVELMDERSDVFALGALLCEILTGAPPYAGGAQVVLELAAKARLDDAAARPPPASSSPDGGARANAWRPSARRAPRREGHRGTSLGHLAAVEARVEARILAAEERVKATERAGERKLSRSRSPARWR